MENKESEEITEIIKNSNMTVPASMIMTFLQFTEVATSRGAVQQANELSVFGNNYDKASKMLQDLIKYKKSKTEVKKKKKEIDLNK